MIRVVIDANTWFSSLMSVRFKRRVESVSENANMTVLVSEPLFIEMNSKKEDKKFDKYFKPWEVDDLIQHLRSTAEMVNVHSVVHDCRDPKDNYLLALAKDGKADYLITGDKDLLALNPYGKTKILPITDFVIEKELQCKV